jgi:hypothetical protein
MPRRFHDLADLQREDAEAESRAVEAAEREFHRRGWFWRKLEIWTKRFELLGAWAKGLGAFLVAVGAIGGVGYKLVRFIADRRVAPAELPAPTGIASTTVDRVPVPPPTKL